MSHVVVRGTPDAAQLAFDVLLDEVAAARGGTRGAEARARVSLPQLLFHCLKKYPQDLFMINADTDEKTTNQQILSQAVLLARMFLARGMKGKVVVMVHDTHRTMLAVYYAAMFAGAVPYVMYCENTALETASFLQILQPELVTCDQRRLPLVTSALEQLPGLNPELLLDLDGLADEEHLNSFQVPEVDPDDTAVMLSTSGTTGLPKIVQLTHRGLMASIPLACLHERSAEYSPDLALVTSYSDGIAFLGYTNCCIFYRMVLLLPQSLPSAERLRDMLLKYRPAVLTLAPTSASALLPLITTDHLSTIQVFFLSGSAISTRVIADIKEKLPQTALLLNIYGSTELHGPIAIGPAGEYYQFSNYIEYKLVDDYGIEVEKGIPGELLVKGPILANGYYKMPQHEYFEDGWYKTGDIFREDSEGKIWYMERKGICFKFMGSYVSPEETEQVIESIEGVVSCVVTGTERGPAAAVVASSDVTREIIHDVVKASLSDFKWLYGGVAFVPSLPRTGLGKLHRRACKELLQQKIDAGECY